MKLAAVKEIEKAVNFMIDGVKGGWGGRGEGGWEGGGVGWRSCPVPGPPAHPHERVDRRRGRNSSVG